MTPPLDLSEAPTADIIAMLHLALARYQARRRREPLS